MPAPVDFAFFLPQTPQEAEEASPKAVSAWRGKANHKGSRACSGKLLLTLPLGSFNILSFSLPHGFKDAESCYQTKDSGRPRLQNATYYSHFYSHFSRFAEVEIS